MHDPIEGRFQVLGEKPPYEPVVKDWRGLSIFVGVTLAAWVIGSVSLILENSRGERASDASRSATAEQTTPGPLTLQHLP